MDLYPAISQRVLTDLGRGPGADDLRQLFLRAAAARPRDWLLPAHVCTAVGGPAEAALAACAGLACLQVSIVLIDDLLDEDPRGAHHQYGVPLTANFAAAFQAAGVRLGAHDLADPAAREALRLQLTEMAWQTALGQYLDTRPIADEAAYWRVVAAKSAPFFGAAFAIGALAGGAAPAQAAGLAAVGRLYGELIQLHDDLTDCLAVPANPDWVQGRSPLPILFAREVAHPERERFRRLCGAATDPAALAEAQAVLVRCGAISYCVAQLLAREAAARRQLGELRLAEPAAVLKLVTDLGHPAETLLALAG